MKTHRVNELIELLHPAWQEDPDLNLIQFLQKLAQEAGFQGNLTELSDDILIYHLKMRGSAGNEQIPGLKKDYEEDFKTALLRARGVIKDSIRALGVSRCSCNPSLMLLFLNPGIVMSPKRNRMLL